MDERCVSNAGGIAVKEDQPVKYITIVLAEEQSTLRHKLGLLLNSEPDFRVIGDVNNGLDALDMIGNLHPDILVFDLHASNNQEIMKLINLRYPKTAIITPYKIGNDSRISEFLRTGVETQILKVFTTTELIKAIRAEKAGKNNLTASVPAVIPQNSRARVEYIEDPIETLTAREREVFNLVVNQMTNVQIAAKLSISPRTVEIHRARVLRKLGLRNQYRQLVNYANQLGILPK
jgi:DNA-binding NarL/FixJ family response regulator